MSESENPEIWPTIILGSGPAGLTAALYAARASIKPLVLGGPQPGGQLTTTTEVENFPGFPNGIQGPELMLNMRTQAERFGAVVEDVAATKLSGTTGAFTITSGDSSYQAKTVIIATGATAMYLGLPSEERLKGKGVSSCATCDGFFFKGKAVAVIGGGDSAMEEALFLTKFATHVTIVHRRDSFKASKIMAERVLNNPNITVVWNHEVQEVLGDTSVTGLTLKSTADDTTQQLEVQGMFVAIGHVPNTHFLQGTIELDPKGYVLPHDITRTTMEGVFVAGDVSDHRYRQAVSAAGAGCMAAIDVEKYLSGQITAW